MPSASILPSYTDHVAPIVTGEEFKKFESVLNAGAFKAQLQRHGFQIVLHGHKHWHEAFVDTAISGGGALLVVSGGTIGGSEARGHYPGFYWLELNGFRDALGRPLHAAGARRLRQGVGASATALSAPASKEARRHG